MRLPASPIVLILSAALLSSCTTPSAQSVGTPSSEASTAPTPTPTLTPTPTVDADDPSIWVISDSGIGPIALGAPLADALALMPEGTARDTDYCEWLAWWNEGADAYDLFVTGAALTDDMPVSLVGTSARNAPAASTGPRTAEGIGVGSSVDEVRAAYPDAVETAGSVDPSIVHLRAGRIFFTYRDDPVITSVTVTSAEEPPYELCG